MFVINVLTIESLPGRSKTQGVLERSGHYFLFCMHTYIHVSIGISL